MWCQSFELLFYVHVLALSKFITIHIVIMVKKDYRFNRILCDTVHDKQLSVLYIQSETPLFSIFLIYLFANDAIIQKFGDSKIYI